MIVELGLTGDSIGGKPIVMYKRRIHWLTHYQAQLQGVPANESASAKWRVTRQMAVDSLYTSVLADLAIERLQVSAKKLNLRERRHGMIAGESGNGKG